MIKPKPGTPTGRILALICATPGGVCVVFGPPPLPEAPPLRRTYDPRLGGYDGQGEAKGENRRRERLWLSPGCVEARRQVGLFTPTPPPRTESLASD